VLQQAADAAADHAHGQAGGECAVIPKITLTDAPTPRMWRPIVEGLVKFNNSCTGKPETQRPLVILLSDPQSDEIVGGLYGSTIFSCLRVDLLFVPESMRRSGIGRKLMAEAEAEALQRGCLTATLETFSFQAPGFYERLGYSVVGIVDDCPPGHSRIFLTKRLVSA
jgi:GNAT superfamily N-acetyltransferase